MMKSPLIDLSTSAIKLRSRHLRGYTRNRRFTRVRTWMKTHVHSSLILWSGPKAPKSSSKSLSKEQTRDASPLNRSQMKIWRGIFSRCNKSWCSSKLRSSSNSMISRGLSLKLSISKKKLSI